MLRRAIVTGAVLLTALLLLVLQNKDPLHFGFVKDQDVRLDLTLRARESATAAQVFDVVLRDPAGMPIIPDDADWKAVDRAVRALAAGNERVGRPELPLNYFERDRKNRISLAVDARVPEFAVRTRLSSKPIHIPGHRRDLLHVTKGIDIQGGVEFLVSLRSNEDGNQVEPDENTVSILRERLDSNGLGEQVVTRLGKNIQIVIPGGGAAEAARTRSIIEQSGDLQFYEVMATLTRDDVIPRPNGRWGFKPGAVYARGDRVFPQETAPGQEPTSFIHVGRVRLEGKDVASASEQPSHKDGSPAVVIQFTAAGAIKNGEFTSEVKQRGDAKTGTGRIAIVFNGVVKSAPVVNEPSTNSCEITGAFTREQVESLKAALRGGSLSVTPQVLSERVVGASLGSQEVERAELAMGGSLLCIIVFMLFYYRRLGIVAIGALGVCLALTWVTMSVYGATLTLPGLAGLILSMAMSIDTNVLIYERIREELAAKKGLKAAIEAGYERAFATVFDTHLTTAIAGLVLYLVGTGPIKGFGLTLMIGIAISMFSGIYVGRLLTDLLCRGRNGLSMSSLFKEVHLPFTAWRKVSFALTIVTAIAGVAYFAYNPRFGLDFTGGVMVQATFSAPLSKTQVDEAIAKQWAANAPDDRPNAQPYFSGTGFGDTSNQWMFRTRDETGVALQGELEILEKKSRELSRAYAEALASPNLDATAKKQAEQAKKAALEAQQAKIVEVQSRIEAFKSDLRKTFPGMIGDDAQEIIAASWQDRLVTLHLKTLDTVSDKQLAEMSARLSKDGPTVSVSKSDVAANTIKVSTTIAGELPPSIKPIPAVNHAANRIERLLVSGTAASTPESRAQALAADHLLTEVAQVGAGTGISLATPFPTSEQFSGQVADKLKWAAVAAIAIALLLMLIYIAARFDVSFGFGAVISLLHVTIQTIGVLALFHQRIDLTVVAGILAVIGYAINDTIVIYDRIRENLRKLAGVALDKVIDLSIAQTMPRTILTSGVVIMTLVIMICVTGDSLQAFSLTMLAGILLGTYSSVFVASPLLLVFRKRIADELAREAEIEAERQKALGTAPAVSRLSRDADGTSSQP